MSKITQTVQSYWRDRSEVFANYYKKPSLFDKIFRRGVYERIGVCVKVCRGIPDAMVLDVGSGPGLNSVSLIKNAGVWHVTGIDFAKEMIDSANETARSEGVAERCNFILADALNYDFNGKKFDFAMALGVFDYIDNAQALIDKMSGLATRAFVISWPENGLRMWLRRRRYTCPLHHYTLDRIKALHEKAAIKRDSLEIVKIGGGWVSIARK